MFALKQKKYGKRFEAFTNQYWKKIETWKKYTLEICSKAGRNLSTLVGISKLISFRKRRALIILTFKILITLGYFRLVSLCIPSASA